MEKKITDEFFKTFSECSLLSTVSKNTIKNIDHRTLKRDMMGQSCSIYACTRIIYRSTLHFAVAGSTVSGLEIKRIVMLPFGNNWRNIVTRCKFWVAGLYNQNNVQVPLVESVWYRLVWLGTHSYNKYFLTYPFLFNNLTLFIFA